MNHTENNHQPETGNHTHENKTYQLIGRAINIAGNIVSLIGSALAKRPNLCLSCEEFVSEFSDEIDNLILKTEKQEKLNYIAGNIILKSLPNNQMQFIIDLYYQNTQGNWINQNHSSDIIDMGEHLADEAIQKLNLQKEIKFMVEKP